MRMSELVLPFVVMAVALGMLSLVVFAWPAQQERVQAHVMVSVGLVDNEGPVTLLAACEPSRMWAPDWECRAIAVEEEK